MNREELKAWLDRQAPLDGNWADWFDADQIYLGETSARTGPDPVVSDQKCACEVCSAGR